ncbi:CsiV family protein [Ningiella sp. W23]|uniref:CsiV family protein n=1 Tax=Ningiella sp. W23 TaxID=3023715 RepID=UPI003758332B
MAQRHQANTHLRNKLMLLCCIGVGILYPQTKGLAQALDSQWWFDVELIAFEREMLPNQEEDFSLSDFEFSDAIPFDIIGPHLYQQSNPNFRLMANLPFCSKEHVEKATLATGTSAVDDALMALSLDNDAMTSLIQSADQFISIKQREDETEHSSEDMLGHATALRTEFDDSEPSFAVNFAVNETLEFISAHQSAVEAIMTPLLSAPPAKLSCVNELQYQAFSDVPRALFANSDYQFATHGLLRNESKYLEDYARQVFNQRDISPILYTAWRQPVVFGEENADYYKIYGGRLLKHEHDSKTVEQLFGLDEIVSDTLVVSRSNSLNAAQSEQATESQNTMSENIYASQAFVEHVFFEKLKDSAMANMTGGSLAGDQGVSRAEQNAQSPSVSDVLSTLDAELSAIEAGQLRQIDWEVDEEMEPGDNQASQSFAHHELEGLFKVYLDYVNRVPYLHIDSQFKHYRVTLDTDGQPELLVYPSQQRRRIISKQIHYFDHPAFGVVVRLQRYEVPRIDSTNAD